MQSIVAARWIADLLKRAHLRGEAGMQKRHPDKRLVKCALREEGRREGRGFAICMLELYKPGRQPRDIGRLVKEISVE
jgi:hypothetical protein